MIDYTDTVRLQRFAQAAWGKALMVRKCVDNSMLHAGWAAKEWQPRILLKPCVVSTNVG